MIQKYILLTVVSSLHLKKGYPWYDTKLHLIETQIWGVWSTTSLPLFSGLH